MDTNANSLNWFEIPVTGMQRAKHFYQIIFSIHMDEQEMMGFQMAMFPYEPGSGKAAGAIVKGEGYKPSAEGTVVYLNANPNMDSVLEKIESEGGKIVMGKTQISPKSGIWLSLLIQKETGLLCTHKINERKIPKNFRRYQYGNG